MAIDELGNWISLGELQLTKEFRLYNISCLNGEIFRFTYNLDWDAWNNKTGKKNKILFRFYYATAEYNVSPSVVLYPKPEKEIRNLQGRTAITGTEQTTYTFDVGARLVPYRQPYFYDKEDIPISLGVEYLVEG